MQLMNEMPSYINFEWRPVKDNEATIEHGQMIYKDVAFVIVTPPGGKQVFEGVAEEWLKNKLDRNDDYYSHYKACYEAWLKQEEMPTKGTSVKNWPAISPAEVKALLGAELRTIEDVATANEPALKRVGPGAVSLKNRAKAWLSTAKNTGKPAEKIAALEAEVENLKTIIEEKDLVIKELQGAVSAYQKEKNVA